MSEFCLNRPLPKYGASGVLKDCLIEYIIKENLSVGAPFLSDREVMEATGRSRTAVRKALDQLQEECWIERRGGIGTFVGAKILSVKSEYIRQFDENRQFVPPIRGNFSQSIPDASTTYAKSDSSSLASHFSSEETPSSKKVLRIGIALSTLDRDPYESGGDYRDPIDAYKIDHIGNDWYSNGVIRGINQVALQDNLVIELLGTHLDQPILLSKRIELSSPDVFVCIGPPLRYASVIGEARRQGIPSVLAMIRAPEIGVPNIYEDNYAGSWEAVHRLYNLGHRRIGFIQILTPGGWWSIDRYEGYRKALADHGLELDESLALWVPQIVPQDGTDIIRRYLHRQQPTAIISGCFRATFYFKELTKTGELSIPRDLSVITYDQLPLVQHFLGGVRPSTIALPLREVGETIGRLARILVEKPKNVPPKTMLPCHFIEGDSIAPYQG